MPAWNPKPVQHLPVVAGAVLVQSSGTKSWYLTLIRARRARRDRVHDISILRNADYVPIENAIPICAISMLGSARTATNYAPA